MAKFRVLIVEDQRDVRRVLRAGLEILEADLEIVDVPSGEEALLVAGSKPFDLLVADIRLAGMSGLELLAGLRRRRPKIKSILITGVSDPKVRKNAVQANADALLFKPLAMADFLSAVKGCLRISSAGLAAAPPEMDASGEPRPPTDLFIAEQLAALQKQMGARAVMLVDRQGTLLAPTGDITGQTPFDAVGAVLSAGETLSRALGSDSPEGLMCFTSSGNDLYLATIDQEHALLLLADPALRLEQRLDILSVLPLAALELGQLVGPQPAMEPTRDEEPAEAPVPESVEVETGPIDPDLSALLQQTAHQPGDELVADDFWEAATGEAAGDDLSRPDLISFDQARQLGLAPDDEEE